MFTINQHHAHPQFADQFLIERLEPAVSKKSDQEGVKLQVESHGANPVDFFDRAFVAFQRASKLRKHIRAVGFCRQDGGDFEQAPYLVNLGDVL